MSERWKAWFERAKEHVRIPNLGSGGIAVAAFVTSFFAAHAADAVFVIFAFGPHAFFIDGLHVTDWKHGILSTGAELPFASDLFRGVLTLLFWIIFVGISEVLVGLVAIFLTNKPCWISGVARLLGGFLLFLFVRLCWLPRPIFHPVPIAAIIGGSVLIWKGTANVFKRDGSTAKFERLIRMMDVFISGENRSRDFVKEMEGEFASCGLDDDVRFSGLQYAIAVFGASDLDYDKKTLANECQYALRILRGGYDA